jgi:hypothetical protein
MTLGFDCLATSIECLGYDFKFMLAFELLRDAITKEGTLGDHDRRSPQLSIIPAES